MSERVEPKTIPPIPLRGEQLSMLPKIETYLDHLYFGPKMKKFPQGSRKWIQQARRSVIDETFTALCDSSKFSHEGKLSPEALANIIGPEAWGIWAEILVWQAIPYCPKLESLRATFTTYARDSQTPGVDLKFGGNDNLRVQFAFSLRREPDLFFTDLYCGQSAEKLEGKIAALIRQKPKKWFILALCIQGQAGLPTGTNHLLELYPGIDQENLKRLIAQLILQVAADSCTLEGKPNPKPSENPALTNAIEERLLAGYKMVKGQSGSNLKEILFLEELIRRRYAS